MKFAPGQPVPKPPLQRPQTATRHLVQVRGYSFHSSLNPWRWVYLSHPFPKLFFLRAHFSHDVQKKHLEVWHTNLLKRIEILYNPKFQIFLNLILNCIIPIFLESQCSWLSFFPQPFTSFSPSPPQIRTCLDGGSTRCGSCPCCGSRWSCCGSYGSCGSCGQSFRASSSGSRAQPAQPGALGRWVPCVMKSHKIQVDPTKANWSGFEMFEIPCF